MCGWPPLLPAPSQPSALTGQGGRRRRDLEAGSRGAPLHELEIMRVREVALCRRAGGTGLWLLTAVWRAPAPSVLEQDQLLLKEVVVVSS